MVCMWFVCGNFDVFPKGQYGHLCCATHNNRMPNDEVLQIIFLNKFSVIEKQHRFLKLKS